MKFLECDLEQIIFETYFDNPDKLYDSGLIIGGALRRQFRVGNYGIADLVSFDRGWCDSYYNFITNSDSCDHIRAEYYKSIEVTVYELKKDKIGIAAFLQAIRYAKGIKSYLNKRKPEIKIVIKIVLIGRTLDDGGSFCFLPDLIDQVNLITYSYGIDGLVFKEHRNYLLTHEGF